MPFHELGKQKGIERNLFQIWIVFDLEIWRFHFQDMKASFLEVFKSKVSTTWITMHTGPQGIWFHSYHVTNFLNIYNLKKIDYNYTQSLQKNASWKWSSITNPSFKDGWAPQVLALDKYIKYVI